MADQTNINLNIDTSILEPLLNDLGVTDMSEEAKVQLLQKIETLLRNRILLRMAEDLTPELLEQIADLQDEQVIQVLSENDYDLPSVMAEQALALREELVGNMSYLQGYIDGLSKS